MINFKPALYMQHTTATQAQVKPRIPYRGHSKARSRENLASTRQKLVAYLEVSSPSTEYLLQIQRWLILSVLDRMNARVSEVENDLGLAEEGDKTMASLIHMVNGVMQSYRRKCDGPGPVDKNIFLSKLGN